MLEILKKREITNVCAVVTRYFGGIKLGAGGLIRAYAGSVGHALDQVGLVKFVTQEQLILTLDYGNYDGLQRFLSTQGLVISESEFLSDVTVKLFVDLDKTEQLLADLIEQFSGKISVAKGEKQLVEVDI